MSLPDLDFDFTNENDGPRVTYPKRSKKMSDGLSKLVSSRNLINSEVNEIVDRATEIGYELGVMDEQHRFSELLEAMLRNAQSGNLVISEALLKLSREVIKDE